MFSFSLGGCELRLKFSCFALLAFCCLFSGAPGGASFLLAVSLHEAAHLALLFLFRSPPKIAEISALGCRIVPGSGRALSFRQSAAVSLAGPLMNLICFLLCFLFGLSEDPFALASLGLGVFHILPIEPLDGGLALRSILSERAGPETAARLSFLFSLILLIPLAVLGFLVLLRSRGNFTLLAISLYLMLYLVLKRDFFSP